MESNEIVPIRISKREYKLLMRLIQADQERMKSYDIENRKKPSWLKKLDKKAKKNGLQDQQDDQAGS